MSSSNSFNTCPRCANSNSLNAKYCSRCGAQLKVPTEAVVCHKCHTRNSSLANFCRNCGATLKVGAQTKICPRCGREIGAEENMCACGYSFVTLQQTEPRRADVSSTNKDKKDKKRDKGRHNEPARAASEEAAPAANNQQKTEKKPKQKKGGRGFALFAFLFLAVFVVLLILPANARGPLTGIDKGIFRPSSAPSEPEASAVGSLPLYAEGDEEVTEPTDPSTEPTDPTEGDGEEEPTPETWTVTFKNGEDTVSTVQVIKGEKLTADQIPADLEIEGKEFKGWWFNGKTQATVGMDITMDMIFTAELTDVGTTPNPNPDPNPNPTPDPEPTPDPDPTPNPDDNETPATIETNVYGWDLIMKIVGVFSDETKAAMENSELSKFKYIVHEYFGTATFVVVVMFALFLVTAVLHLLVCLIRIISPRRSRRSNLLFLILAVCTTVLVIMMFASQAIKSDNAFKAFFAPTYDGLACSYGYVVVLIPVYYWFFWLYSCIAKKKMPKKSKKKDKGE